VCKKENCIILSSSSPTPPPPPPPSLVVTEAEVTIAITARAVYVPVKSDIYM
jgi:hypothetical protein